MCSYCKHLSKVVYGWWNSKSLVSGVASALYWFHRRIRIAKHCSPWPKSYNSQNHNQYNNGDPNSVSQHTVQCILLCMGLNSWRLKHISEQMHAIAKKHQNWTLEEWKKVTRSDESHILVHHINGQVWICWFLKKTLALGSKVGQSQANGGDIMVCNILMSTLGLIITIKQSFMSVYYMNIVAHHSWQWYVRQGMIFTNRIMPHVI